MKPKCMRVINLYGRSPILLNKLFILRIAALRVCVIIKVLVVISAAPRWLAWRGLLCLG